MKRSVHEHYPANGRVILHLDMNAFYCSVHAAEDPARYKGVPTAVAGSVELRKGIIVTCSYHARERGVKTGMTVREGMRLCPQLVLIKPDFDLYRTYSRAFLAIARQYTPLVEVVSIDECYLDITGSKAMGTPLEIAEMLQYRIGTELALPCSVGVAPNKLLAKVASDMRKPSGLTVLRIRDVPNLLWSRRCDTLPGIGSKTADKLWRLNIRTLGELAAADEGLLRKQFGVIGGWLRQAANGYDDSPVNPVREPRKSVGHTTTLPQDVSEWPDVRRVLLNLADQTGRRLRRQHELASGVQITIRTPDMKTITRSITLSTPIESTEDIFKQACSLYQTHWTSGQPIRLLGITLHQLNKKQNTALQLDLFSYEEQPRKEALTSTMDRLRDRFGEGAVLTAGMLGDDPSALIRNRKRRGTSLQPDDEAFHVDEEE